jgi:hypothetical protein
MGSTCSVILFFYTREKEINAPASLGVRRKFAINQDTGILADGGKLN